MAAVMHRLNFEKPIYELEDQIAGLEAKHDKSAKSSTRCAGCAVSWPSSSARSLAS